MNDCEKYRELISLYLDNEISEKDKIKLERHLEVCEECRNELEFLRGLISDINNIKEEPLPAGFHENMMKAVKADNFKKINRKPLAFDIKKVRNFSAAAASVILAFMVFGSALSFINNRNNSESALPEISYAGGVIEAGEVPADNKTITFEDSFDETAQITESEEEYALAEEPALSLPVPYAAPAPLAPAADEADNITRNQVLEDRHEELGNETEIIREELEAARGDLQNSLNNANKLNDTAQNEASDQSPDILYGSDDSSTFEIDFSRLEIKNYTIDIEVENAKEAVEKIKSFTQDINSSGISLDSANIELSVPSAGYESILEGLKALGEIRGENLYLNDVTDQVNDAVVRFNAKTEERDRLVSLISRARKAEDIITIEERISEIEYERGSLKATVINNRAMAENVTISVNLYESFSETYDESPIFSERVSVAFTSSVNFAVNIFEGSVIALSYASAYIFIAVIILFILIAVKRVKKKGGGKDE